MRPFLQVRLTNTGNGRSIPCWALVDSGADYNLFPSAIGEVLGHDLPKGRKIATTGVGGGIASFVHRENRLEAHEDLGPIEPDVAFSDDMNLFGFGLLGQRGFFDHYRVRFDFRAATFSLDPY